VCLTLRAELATPRHRVLPFRTRARVGAGVTAGVGSLWYSASQVDGVLPGIGEDPLTVLGLAGGAALAWVSARYGVRRYRGVLRSTEDALALFLDQLDHRFPPSFIAVDSVSFHA